MGESSVSAMTHDPRPMTASAASNGPRPMIRPVAREDFVAGYLFILPTLAILAAYYLWPILQAFGMSFFRWDLLTQEHEFIGLRNYQVLLASGEFWLALRNTGYYVLGVVP